MPNRKMFIFLDAHLGKQGWALSEINHNFGFKICEALSLIGPLVTSMIIQWGHV